MKGRKIELKNVLKQILGNNSVMVILFIITILRISIFLLGATAEGGHWG